MSQWPVTHGSGGIDPPTIDDLNSGDTPELIEVYARAWERKADVASSIWISVTCKQQALALYREATRRRVIIAIGDIVLDYPEAGDDEPTVEKLRPATICYVCASAFQPEDMRVILESGATVCRLCHTLF